MTPQNLFRNTTTLRDAIDKGTYRARALARVLQTAATSDIGVENHELIEVADIIVSELDKVIDAKEGLYGAFRSHDAKKALEGRNERA